MNSQQARIILLGQLRNHIPWDRTENDHLQNLIRFVQEEDDCFLRELQKGHLTGSAWITDDRYSSVVLLHHRKLNRWLQPGGHADGMTDIFEVARKEAMEETGLLHLRSDGKIFDVDVHRIPANAKDPAHFHYDIRYHFIVPSGSEVHASSESHQVSWIEAGQVGDYSGFEPSIIRMRDKWLSAKQKGEARNQ